MNLAELAIGLFVVVTYAATFLHSWRSYMSKPPKERRAPWQDDDFDGFVGALLSPVFIWCWWLLKPVVWFIVWIGTVGQKHEPS